MSDSAPQPPIPTPIADRTALDRWLARKLDDGPPRRLAIDIEEDRMRRYRAAVALIQVSDTEEHTLIDPLLLPSDAVRAALLRLLEHDPMIVLHGGANDVAGIKRDFGVSFPRLRDTQIAARFAGVERFGLASLLESRFDVRLDKKSRRSDWTKRPLSPKQLRYASADTRHLLALWDELSAEAAARGWEDAVIEECEALATLPADSGEHADDGWARVKGFRKLPEPVKRRLYALWCWRDRVARDEDMHPSRVLAPWAVANLAKRGPSLLSAKKGVPGLSDRILDAERDALHTALDSPGELPEPDRPRKPRISREERRRRRDREQAIVDWRRGAAKRLELDAGWLLPRSLAKQIAALDEPTVDDLANVPDIRRWRIERFADDWLRTLKETG